MSRSPAQDAASKALMARINKRLTFEERSEMAQANAQRLGKAHFVRMGLLSAKRRRAKTQIFVAREKPNASKCV